MSFTVFIETGLHAGAVQRLEPGLYTIGSELDSDIVLSDPDVAAVHAILEFDEAGLRLEPAKGSVFVHGETGLLEPGDERYLNLPTEFSIAETKISVRAPKDAVRARNQKRYAIAGMASAVLFVIGLYVIGPLSSSFSPVPMSSIADNAATPERMQASVSEPDVAQEEIQSAPKTTSPDMSPPSQPPTEAEDGMAASMDMAAGALRDRLAAEDLDSINVVVRQDHLVARGTAAPEQMPGWQTVQMWFDGEYGGAVSLISEVSASEKVEPPKLAIEAIWAGDDPYIMAGGRRYFEGAKIGEGWTVEQIRPEQITLRRGDQSFSITL